MLVEEKKLHFPPHVRHRRLLRGGRVWMAAGCEVLALKWLKAVLLVLVPLVVLMNYFSLLAGVEVGLLALQLPPGKVGVAVSGPRWWRVHPHRRLSSTSWSQTRSQTTRTRWSWQQLRCPVLPLGTGCAVWASWYGAQPAAGPGRVAAELLGQRPATARLSRQSSQAIRPGCSLCTQSSSFAGSPSV